MNFHKLKSESKIIYQPEDIESSSKTLDPGIYLLKDEGGMMSTKITLTPLEPQNLIAFSEGTIKQFLKEVDYFLSPNTKEIYKELKMRHSTGFILFGKPGTGKTCLATLAMDELCKKYQAICIDITRCGIKLAKHLVRVIRQLQSNPIVLFSDECDNDIRLNEGHYLPFLDGNESVDDLIFLGCTNNIDRIPERIRHRKSRIKKCFEIKSLPIKVYQEYVEERLPNLEKSLFSELCFKAVENSLTIDQFKNTLLDYRLGNTNIDKAIELALETYKGDEEEIETEDE